jgi:hypothetical protein
MNKIIVQLILLLVNGYKNDRRIKENEFFWVFDLHFFLLCV